ncbi:MAG TPA: DUF922 domain-containing protein [Burkholderiales bacterium]|nr:DUF922 domain-containing protein [Burkholderiales bacterium]
MDRLRFAAPFFLAALATSAGAEPLVRMGMSYYYIDGGSALVLTEQMNQKGPIAADGKHYPSLTKWDVQWKYRNGVHGGTCKVEEAAVAVGVTSTLPRWRGEANGPKSLRERWRRLLEAVGRDQGFHKELAIRAGKEIEAALLAVKPAADCDALTEAANDTAEQILKKHRAADEEYDRKYQHGLKDGATLM